MPVVQIYSLHQPGEGAVVILGQYFRQRLEFYKINRTVDDVSHLFRAVVALNGTASEAVFTYFSDTSDSHKW